MVDGCITNEFVDMDLHSPKGFVGSVTDIFAIYHWRVEQVPPPG